MRFSYILAAAILIALGAWLYTGDIVVGGRGDSEPAIAEQNAASAPEARPLRVKVERIVAQTRRDALLLRGRTEAENRVTLRAETEGTIELVAVDKGDMVAAGDLLCRIETRTRKARLAEAEARLVQAQADFEAAEKLADKGFTAQTRVRVLRALRDAARANVEAAEWDLARTEIVAPSAGIVETLDVRKGSLLSVGDICAALVDIDPMLAVAQVSERELGGLSLGMPAQVKPVTGGTFDGTISYIAPAADPATRTFRIEITLDNASGALRDGITSEIAIPLASQMAHKFSPAVLVLGDDGVIGVRSVDSDNRVVFHVVRLLGDGGDGVWVSGLPETVDLIVRGQEYVTEGLLVEPVTETAEAAQ